MSHRPGISAERGHTNTTPKSHGFLMRSGMTTDLLCILDPLDLLPVGGYVLERLCVVDGEDEQEALPRPHVLVPHGRVLLLAGRVQDVQQTRLPVDDHLLAVGVLDGGVVLVHKVVLDQLDGEGGLAHASG